MGPHATRAPGRGDGPESDSNPISSPLSLLVVRLLPAATASASRVNPNPKSVSEAAAAAEAAAEEEGGDGGEAGALEHPQEPQGEEEIPWKCCLLLHPHALLSRLMFLFLYLCAGGMQFMQRAAVAQKVEEKPKVEAAAAEEEEVVTVPSGGVGSSVKVARKWYGD